MHLQEERILSSAQGDIPVKVYTKKKRSSSVVFRHNTLFVYLASHLSKKDQEKTINEFLQWGKSTLQKSQIQQRISLPELLAQQEHILLYNGEQLFLRHKWGTHRSFRFRREGDILYCIFPDRILRKEGYQEQPLPQGFTLETKKEFLKALSLALIPHLQEEFTTWVHRLHADHFAHIPIQDIAYKYLTSRWGSCSHKQELTFSTLLFLLPQPLVEYVILHELTHLEHMSHCHKFWARMREVLPEAMIRRKQLGRYE